MPTPPLPGLPSALIRVVLADLRKVEAKPDIYKVEMETWHDAEDNHCEVCLAGAVIAQTLNQPQTHIQIPVDLSTTPATNF